LRTYNIDGVIGDATRAFFTSAPTLSNNLVGGWAVVERDFASYTTGTGLGALNQTGYAGYSPNTILTVAASAPTENIRLTTNAPTLTTTTTLTDDRDINALAINAAGASTLDLGGFTLSLRSGGLIASNNIDNTAITIQNGNITAGAPGVGGDLYLHALSYVNGDTNTINRDTNIGANIIDNGAGVVTLVINADDGRGTGVAGLLGATATTLSGFNTYTGGTFINSGRVILATPGADGFSNTATGTGDVTIVGGASTNGSTFQERSATLQLGASDQIYALATVNLYGGSTFDLNGFSQILNNVVFHNTGGNTPQITLGNGFLILNGGITADGAVAARALGKPCIVGCSGVAVTKEALKGASLVLPGARVTIDGAAGTIEI